MKTATIAVALVAFVALAVEAHDGHKTAKPAAVPAKGTTAKVAPKLPMKMQKVQLVGELVDPQCWFTHMGEGPDHRNCAVACAKGGQDLALYERETGRLYPIIAASHGQNPNKGLIEHVATPVRVSGSLYSRGTNLALLVTSVQRVGTTR